MKDLQSELRRNDPLAHEKGLSQTDVERMRCHVLATRPEGALRQSRVFFALAATMLVMLVGGVLLTRTPLSPNTRRAVVTGSTVRQLQLSTPSGTRVFWTFDPNFEVR